MATLEITVDPDGSDNNTFHVLNLLVTVEQEVAIHGLFQLNKWRLIKEEIPDTCEVCNSSIKKNIIIEENQLQNFFTNSESAMTQFNLTDVNKSSKQSEGKQVKSMTEDGSNSIQSKCSVLSSLLQGLPSNTDMLPSNHDLLLNTQNELPSNAELLSSNTVVLPSDHDMLVSNPNVLSNNSEMLPSNMEITYVLPQQYEHVEIPLGSILNNQEEEIPKTIPLNNSSSSTENHKDKENVGEKLNILLNNHVNTSSSVSGRTGVGIENLSDIGGNENQEMQANCNLKQNSEANCNSKQNSEDIVVCTNSEKILVDDSYKNGDKNESLGDVNGDDSWNVNVADSCDRNENGLGNKNDQGDIDSPEKDKKIISVRNLETVNGNDCDDDIEADIDNYRNNIPKEQDTTDSTEKEKITMCAGGLETKKRNAFAALNGSLEKLVDGNSKYKIKKPETQIGEEYFPYQCEECDRGFVKEEQLKRHSRIHKVESPHVCHICGKLFIHKQSLKSHMKCHDDESNPSKIFTCDICNKTFTFSSSLKRHINIHFDLKPYICQICGKQFRQHAHLKDHLGIHNNIVKQKPYKCEYCDKWFAHTNARARHRLTHTGKKPFSCQICGKKFTQSHHMKSHEKLHSEEMPFKCDVCGNGFTTRSALNFHSNHVHMEKADEDLHKCSVCNKAFSVKGSLQKHMNIHTQEKMHECDTCGRKFTQLVSLKRHEKTHMKPKIYKCYICGKTFTDKIERKKHSRWHDKERERLKEYRCVICDKFYTVKTSYLKHMKKEHGEKEEAGCGDEKNVEKVKTMVDVPKVIILGLNTEV